MTRFTSLPEQLDEEAYRIIEKEGAGVLEFADDDTSATAPLTRMFANTTQYIVDWIGKTFVYRDRVTLQYSLRQLTRSIEE
jgi:hypothetical protein